MTFYHFMRGFARAILKTFMRIEWIGEENIICDKSALYCSNHLTIADPVILGVTKKIDFYYMAKEEIVELPVLGGLFKKLNLIPIKRGAGDLGAIRKSIEVLNEGKSLMIFPEGTRSKDGKLHEGKNGAALILRKTNASVVPCAIIGKPGIFKKVKAVYGKEIDISDIRDNRDLSLITTRIMDSIEKLIKENS